mgnify:FL=1
MNIPLNIDWQQILLHLFNFTILAGGLYLLLYRPVKEFMKKRDAYYQGINDQAEQLKQQADQLKKDYQQKLSEADSEIAQKRADVQKQLEAFRQQQVSQAENQAQAILQKAKESADREHEQMLSKASKELTDLAVSAAEKIVLKDQGDPYDQFLNLVEGEKPHEQSKE